MGQRLREIANQAYSGLVLRPTQTYLAENSWRSKFQNRLLEKKSIVLKDYIGSLIIHPMGMLELGSLLSPLCSNPARRRALIQRGRMMTFFEMKTHF